MSEPARLALVDDLARKSACACELRERLGLSAPLISHHLKVLREAGLVRTRKAGRRLEVELDREALGRVAASLLASASARSPTPWQPPASSPAPSTPNRLRWPERTPK